MEKNPYILLTPGPVPLLRETRKILSEPALHHRSPEFQKIFAEVRKKLQCVFQTKEDVLVLNSSGTGAMEAGLINTLSPGDEVICVCAGKFGERWRDMALSHGLKARALNISRGKALSLPEAEESLKKHPRAKAFLVSACETSTGTEHPVGELSFLLRKYPDTLFMVDGVTGIGAMKLGMDEMGIDVLVGGSQKSFALPAGLSFTALSRKAWRFQKNSSCPRYYFDLKREKTAQRAGQTAFSANVSLVKALGGNLTLFQRKGLEHFIRRSRLLAETSRFFCKNLNIPLFSERPAGAVTALKPPGGSAEKIKGLMETEDRVIVAGGQGEMKGKILRIGHLGPVTNGDLLKGLGALGHQIRKVQPGIYSEKKLKETLSKARKKLSV